MTASTSKADKRRRFHEGVTVLSNDEVLSILNTQMARQENDLALERRFLAALTRHNRERKEQEEAEEEGEMAETEE